MAKAGCNASRGPEIARFSQPTDMGCLKTRNFGAPMEGDKGRLRITNEPLPPAFEVPESYNQVNAILSYYNLPNIESSDSINDKALALKKIRESIEGIAIEDETFEKLEKIREYKRLERECDLMEVELANSKIDSLQKFSNKSTEELAEVLEGLRNQHERSRVQKTHLPCKSLVESISKGCSLDCLWFYKDETRGAYLQQKALGKLAERTEEWARVLYKVIKEHCCRVEDIVHELGVDRVDLLRIIYSYSAKGILEYDRLNDSVSIKETR